MALTFVKKCVRKQKKTRKELEIVKKQCNFALCFS